MSQIQKENKLLGFSAGYHQVHRTQQQAVHIQGESGNLAVESQSIPWLDPQPVVIFNGGWIWLLLLVKSRQTLNKPCLRTGYDPVTEYTKTTLALKQFSTALVGEEDDYRTEWIKAGNRNTVPYNYTVEVTKIQGIRSDKSPWKNMDGGLWHCTGGSDQDHPQEKEMQKGKMVVWGLTNGCVKKRS